MFVLNCLEIYYHIGEQLTLSRIGTSLHVGDYWLIVHISWILVNLPWDGQQEVSKRSARAVHEFIHVKSLLFMTADQ